MGSQEPTRADYERVLKCLEDFECDCAGHGAEVLKRLYDKNPDLEGKMEAKENGKIVLMTLCKPLKAKGKHTDIIKKMATSDNKTDKFVLRNFKLITEALVKVMVEKACLDAAGQGALKRVIECVIECIKES